MQRINGMDVIVKTAAEQKRTPRDIKGPWIRPRVPPKRYGRKGTRRQYKRANPPHQVWYWREPTDVICFTKQVHHRNAYPVRFHQTRNRQSHRFAYARTDLLTVTETMVMAKLFGGPPWFMKKSPKFSWGFGKNKVPEKSGHGSGTDGSITITVNAIDGEYSLVTEKKLTLDWFQEPNTNWIAYVPNQEDVVTVKRNPGGGWDAFYNRAVIGNSPTKEEAMTAAEVVALT